jgi:hypothetical protein
MSEHELESRLPTASGDGAVALESAKATTEPARMFEDGLANRSHRHREVWRWYQIAYDVNDLCAGALFVVGSLLFYDESQQVAATTLFVIGSLAFCVRPLIHVLRDFHLTRLPK